MKNADLVGRINHSGHDHPDTPHARKKCREAAIQEAKALLDEGAAHAAEPKRRTRKRVSAKAGKRPARKQATVKKPPMPKREAEAQAAVVDTLLDKEARREGSRTREGMLAREAESSVALDKGDGATYSIEAEPSRAVVEYRDRKGRFTRETLQGWGALLDHLDGAQDYLNEQGADLIEARLTTTLGGNTFVATFDGSGWTVEVQ